MKAELLGLVSTQDTTQQLANVVGSEQRTSHDALCQYLLQMLPTDLIADPEKVRSLVQKLSALQNRRPNFVADYPEDGRIIQ